MNTGKDNSIREKIEAYLRNYKNLRYYRVFMIILAIIATLGTGMTLRYYGHALSQDEFGEDDDSDENDDSEGNADEPKEDIDVEDDDYKESDNGEDEIPYKEDCIDRNETDAEDSIDEKEDIIIKQTDDGKQKEKKADKEDNEEEGTTESIDEDEEEETETETELSTEEETEIEELVSSYLDTKKTYEDSKIEVTAIYTEDAKIPDDAELQVTKLKGNRYDYAVKEAEKNVPDIEFGEDVTFAYDISFIYEGEEIEPQDTVKLIFHFKNGEYDDKSSLTIVHLAEEKTEVMDHISVDDGESSIEVDSFSIYIITAENEQKETTDISDNITSIVFCTREGKEITPDANGQYVFNEDDQVYAEIKIGNVRTKDLKNGIATIQLPKSLNVSLLLGKKQKFYDYNSTTFAGTFWISEDNQAVLEMDDGYLESVSSFSGGISFEFSWELIETSSKEEIEQIKLGDFEGTVVIKQKEVPQETVSGYWANKEIKDITYEKDGSVTLKYAIEVGVNADLKDKIIIKDVISQSVLFENVSYIYKDSSWREKKLDDGYVVVSQNSEKKTIEIGNEEGVLAGRYIIEYTANYTKEQIKQLKGKNIDNEISYGEWNSKRVSTYIVPTISKRGTVVNEVTGSVKWIVSVNKGWNGSIISPFEQEERFEDTLPKGTELDGEASFIQYNMAGAQVGTIKCSAVKNGDGTTTLSATLPGGSYQYEMNYFTKQTETPPVGETFQIVNKAEVSGEKVEATVETNLQKITKSFVENKTKEKTYYTVNGTRYEVMEIAWKVLIRGGSDANKVYYDENTSGAVQNFMSNEQMKHIVVKAGDTALVSGIDYEISPYDKGIFQIKFLREIQEDITLAYTCYADVTNVAINGNTNVANTFGDITASKWIEKKYQSKSKVLHKYIKGKEPTEESQVNLETKRVLSWEILVDGGIDPTKEQVFVDTIPAGLAFDEKSLEVRLNYWVEVHKVPGMCKVKKEMQKDGSTRVTISFDPNYDESIMQAAGYWWSNKNNPVNRIQINYDTIIVDDKFLDGSATTTSYTNIVEWGDEWNEHTAEVTRTVVGKSGSFDEEQRNLQYVVFINPDASHLNPNGELLMLEDVLTEVSGITMELGNIGLYTIIERKAGEFEAGAKVADLTPLTALPGAGENARENTYYYDQEKNKITAFISDGKAYALVYNYFVYGSLANSVTVSNKAQLSTGNKTYKEVYDSTQIPKMSMNAWTLGDGIQILLYKRDANVQSLILGGAQFLLEKWDGEQWKEVKRYTTEEGKPLPLMVETNCYYRLTEEVSPKGYVLGDDKKVFIVSGGGELPKLNNEDTEPTVFLLNKEKENRYVIDITNEREKTSFKVYKKWENAEGEEIQRTSGKVEFGLFRKVVPYSESEPGLICLQDVEYSDAANYDIYKKTHGSEYVADYVIDFQKQKGSWSMEFNDQPKMSEDNMMYQYYIVEKSAFTSDNDQLLEVRYEKDDNAATLIMINKITSEYSLPETGGKGSLLFQICNWIQTLWQAIIKIISDGAIM